MPFYAVALGKKPGVYNTWPECQEQVNGFHGARFKKFNTAEEAADFVDATLKGRPTGVSSKSATGTSSKPKAYYAVARGTKTGIYETWAECTAAIDGFKFPKYRKFATHDEAAAFIAENSQPTSSPSRPTKRSATAAGLEPGASSVPAKKSEPEHAPDSDIHNDPDVPVVYTDGACSGNGRNGAIAGYGVYWGDGHPDNVSKPLIVGPGQAHTNNRAEYQAVIEAVTQAKQKGLRKLLVRTDSNLLIKSMTQYLPGWKKKGWKLANGEDVKNQDLLKEIDALQKDVEIIFEHVPGHAGIHGNEMADKFARAGAAKARNLGDD
uniref:Ribonuclease H1 n=1 Tax=Panagrellus redivivus TaxID=6233 RepID=A0A7E4VBB0_PANRE